jgi:glycosyltransferase involved in cell wall biosynthesis
MPASSCDRVVVAVPVRDEILHLEPCLRALAFQHGRRDHEILVLINNSSDGSAEAARCFAETSPARVIVHEVTLPPEQANAGHARRLALDFAAARLGTNGVIMTTDADGQVPPDWVDANLRALAAGADAVAGRAEVHAIDAAHIPPSLQHDDALECAYAALLDEMADRIDPDPVDPWPRHDEHSGASIAVRLPVFYRAGGVPPVLIGEDRAFFAALRRVDARIRHDRDIAVVVSGRIHGRAFGGMADTIRRRLARPDPTLDSRLEPALARMRRLRLRHRARRAWSFGHLVGLWRLDRLAADLGLKAHSLRACMDERYFGTAWAAVEAACPDLCHHTVAAEDVLRQTRMARAVLERIVVNQPAAKHPADTVDADPAG